MWGSPAGLRLPPNRWGPICAEGQRAHLLPQRGSEGSSLPSGVPFSRTHVHTYTHLCTNLPSASRSRFAARGRGSERRAHGGCSTWLSRWGLRRGKDLTEKGGGAPQSPAAGHRGRAGEGRWRRRASGHLPAREAPGCGHTAAGPRRSPGPAGVYGPAPRRKGSGRNFAADGGAAGNKLENGSALVSKSQRRERLATIMISVTSVKYSIIRDYSSTYCK